MFPTRLRSAAQYSYLFFLGQSISGLSQCSARFTLQLSRFYCLSEDIKDINERLTVPSSRAFFLAFTFAMETVS